MHSLKFSSHFLAKVTLFKVSKACADAIAVCAKMIRHLDSGAALTVFESKSYRTCSQSLMCSWVDDVKETKRSFEKAATAFISLFVQSGHGAFVFYRALIWLRVDAIGNAAIARLWLETRRT